MFVCVFLAATEALEGGVVLGDAKIFPIRYIPEGCSDHSTGSWEVRSQSLGESYIILTCIAT